MDMTWSQVALAGAFLTMGTLHFAAPRPFDQIMPRVIPRKFHRPLVYASGLCELAGGAGVLLPATRALAGVGLLCVLVAVFPANVQMLLDHRARKASKAALAALWVRLPIQAVLLAWVWSATLR